MHSSLVRMALPVLAFVAVACDPDTAGPPVPRPLTLAVSPRTADLSGCVPVQLTVQLSGGENGLSRGVEWRSRDPSVATVDADGLVTRAGDGDTWIVASAVADPTAIDSSFATTNVADGGGFLRIRIDRITTGPDSTAVDVDAVSGVIDAVIAVEGVTACAALDHVELRLDDRVVGTRPAQATSFTRVLSVDTRATDPLTGGARWPDGEHVLKAILVLKDGRVVATPVIRLTFANGSPP